MRHSVWLAVACLALGACAGAESTPRAATTTSSAATTATPSSTTPATTTTTKPRTTTTTKAPTVKPKQSAKPPAPKPSAAKLRTSLRGDSNDAFAFAPLSNPGNVTVEGSVSSYKAWST